MRPEKVQLRMVCLPYDGLFPSLPEVQAYTCTFDRVCVCADLWEIGSDEDRRVVLRGTALMLS